MNNKKLKNIAEKVINKIPNDDPTKFGSIIVILMVISIILTVIRVLQECHKNKMIGFNKSQKYDYFGAEMKNTAIRRSWFTKMVIKKAIRKELSRDNYKEYGIALMNAILDTGANLTEDELQTLVEAANV